MRNNRTNIAKELNAKHSPSTLGLRSLNNGNVMTDGKDNLRFKKPTDTIIMNMKLNRIYHDISPSRRVVKWKMPCEQFVSIIYMDVASPPTYGVTKNQLPPLKLSRETNKGPLLFLQLTL